MKKSQTRTKVYLENHDFRRKIRSISAIGMSRRFFYEQRKQFEKYFNKFLLQTVPHHHRLWCSFLLYMKAMTIRFEFNFFAFWFLLEKMSNTVRKIEKHESKVMVFWFISQFKAEVTREGSKLMARSNLSWNLAVKNAVRKHSRFTWCRCLVLVYAQFVAIKNILYITFHFFSFKKVSKTYFYRQKKNWKKILDFSFHFAEFHFISIYLISVYKILDQKPKSWKKLFHFF